MGFLWWLSGKEYACQCRKCLFSPCVGKIPWRREWQPTPVFLPEESHGQGALAGKESDMTERLNMHTRWIGFVNSHLKNKEVEISF